MLAILMTAPSIAFALPISISTETFAATSGQSFLDLEGNGTFERSGSSAATSLVAASFPTSIDGVGDVHAVIRSGLTFDISSLEDIRFPTLQVLSATLSLWTFSATDIGRFPPGQIGDPIVQLHGFAGTGALSSSDMLIDSYLSSFQSSDDQGVAIDVTRFIERMLRDDSFLPKFTLRIADDYNLATWASFYYGSDNVFDEPTARPEYAPRLSVRAVRVLEPVTVPEPGTLSLFAAGLLALGFIRWRTQAQIR